MMPLPKPPQILTFGDDSEKSRRGNFLNLLRDCPIPEEEILQNLGLFLTPQTLSRILFLNFLYAQILEIQGVAMEFGCRWGQTVSLFSALRGVYEPYNRLRKIVAFDTFEGFMATTEKDSPRMSPGMYAVTPAYEEYLEQILALQERESPLSHLKKYQIVKGDASESIHRYLRENPETIVALAYFDLDLYQPTRECLLAIKDRLTIGSVLGFDELNDPVTPGETLALQEVFGLGRYSLRRYPYNSRASYLIVEHG